MWKNAAETDVHDKGHQESKFVVTKDTVEKINQLVCDRRSTFTISELSANFPQITMKLATQTNCAQWV